MRTMIRHAETEGIDENEWSNLYQLLDDELRAVVEHERMNPELLDKDHRPEEPSLEFDALLPPPDNSPWTSRGMAPANKASYMRELERIQEAVEEALEA